MNNSFKFYNNRDCKYLPCHKIENKDEFNCMFCFCPMYWFEDCLGNPNYITGKNGKKIKDCSGCCFPHMPENYDKIMDFIRKRNEI